jgi:hypothetical protein
MMMGFVRPPLIIDGNCTIWNSQTEMATENKIHKLETGFGLSTAAIFLIASLILNVYIMTLSPSIAGGDSGEIVAEGCSLGTAHPPGYPLITLIIYAIKVLIPYGTVAYRVNMLSAVLTTLASIFIGHTVALCQQPLHNKLTSLNTSGTSSVANGAVPLAMGLFAFSPLIWQYATTAEVFPLNTMFAALLLYLVLLFANTRKLSIAYLGAFFCGLV